MTNQTNQKLEQAAIEDSLEQEVQSITNRISGNTSVAGAIVTNIHNNGEWEDSPRCDLYQSEEKFHERIQELETNNEEKTGLRVAYQAYTLMDKKPVLSTGKNQHELYRGNFMPYKELDSMWVGRQIERSLVAKWQALRNSNIARLVCTAIYLPNPRADKSYIEFSSLNNWNQKKFAAVRIMPPVSIHPEFELCVVEGADLRVIQKFTHDEVDNIVNTFILPMLRPVVGHAAAE
jgi:hypothetical protein